jgi:hypothetical protein
VSPRCLSQRSGRRIGPHVAPVRRADNVQRAIRRKGRIGLIDQFGSAKSYAADFVLDLLQRTVRRLRQTGVNRPQVRSLIKLKPVVRLQRSDHCRAVAGPASSRTGPRLINQHGPQIRRTVGLIGSKRQARPLARPVFVIGAGRLKIENQDLEAAQQLPDGLIVSRRSRHREIGAKYIDEVAHPFRREFLAIHLSREGRAIRELPRPMQNLLTRVLHPRRRPGDRDGQFVSAGLEVGLLRGIPHLGHDIPEFRVGGRERQGTFGLNFQHRGRAVGVHRLDDHVIQGMARSALLKAHGSDSCTRQAARFAAAKQRQKIERADLSLELRAGVAGRCRRRNLRRFQTFFVHRL